MKTFVRLFIFLFFLGPSFFCLAQQDLSLPLLRHIGQHNATNPASTIDSTRLLVSLPSIAYQLRYTGVNYQDVVQEKNGERVVDINFAINQLQPTDNDIVTEAAVETLRFIYNTPKWSAQIHHATRFQSEFKYPKGLAQIAWQGNAPFIGQTLEIGPSLDFLSYEEIGIGGSLKLAKLRIGGTLKFLAGVGAITTPKSSAALYTDEAIYELELTTDYVVQTADMDRDSRVVDFGIFSFDAAGISPSSFAFPEFQIDANAGLFQFAKSKNRGFALDLGATYDLNEQWTVGLSLLDIGAIKWKENTNTYTSKATNTFEGVTIGRIDFNKDELYDFESLTDTLDHFLTFTESTAAFTTDLPTNAYLTVNYQVSSKLEMGVVLHGRFSETTTLAAAVSANYQVFDFLRLGAVSSIQEDAYFNLGLNATVQVGPFQLYAIANSLPTILTPLQTNYQTIRVGSSFIF